MQPSFGSNDKYYAIIPNTCKYLSVKLFPEYIPCWYILIRVSGPLASPPPLLFSLYAQQSQPIGIVQIAMECRQG